jgi:hypothetical protein
MKDYLHSNVLNQIEIKMEGMSFQLNVHTAEKLHQWR